MKLDSQNKVLSAEMKWWKILGVGLCLIIFFWGGYKIANLRNKNIADLNKLNSANNVSNNLNEAKEDNETIELSNKDPEVGGIVEKVSKHMLLPAGEITVATVEDPEALRQKNPAVFKYVKKGDRLLIHSEGMIVYDPVLDKIVDAIRELK